MVSEKKVLLLFEELQDKSINRGMVSEVKEMVALVLRNMVPFLCIKEMAKEKGDNLGTCILGEGVIMAVVGLSVG